MSERVLVDRQDGVCVASLVGEIDISNANLVGERLMRALSNEDFGLVIDLRETAYLDSAGVNVIFELAERLDGRQQRLVAVMPERAVVRRLVELVDLGSVADIHESMGAAMAAVQSLR